MSNAKAETWLKDGTAYSKYGNPDIVLNKRGKKAWKNYEHTNVSQWCGREGLALSIKSINTTR